MYHTNMTLTYTTSQFKNIKSKKIKLYQKGIE